MKRLLVFLLCLLMVVSVSACSVSTDTGNNNNDNNTSDKQNNDEKTNENAKANDETKENDESDQKPFEGVSLEIAERYAGESSDIFKQLASEFEDETGAKIQLTEYGDDYENMMKTRMASNTLPDIFQTHGWSILRYKEYLLDLRNEPFVKDYNKSALGVIEDDDGSIYILMTSSIANCILVNLEVCEASGVDIYSINTWDEFDGALAKIKEAGYTPLGQAAGGGNLANIAGTWVSYEGSLAEDSESMLNGTYDWESFVPLLEKNAEWLDKGYMFEDYPTIKGADAMERFAANESAFWLGNGAPFLLGSLALNPDGKYAMVPTFTSTDEGKRFVGIGEGDTFGIWKDGDNIDASKAFLSFMAKPENAVRLNQSTGYISALESAMAIDNGQGLEYFKTMQEKSADANVLYENLWDRKYMPSGMWPVFKTGLDKLISDHSDDGIQEVKEFYIENYNDLYAAANAK